MHFTALLLLVASPVVSMKKRNVLHFILDDLSPEHTRLPARTPHIDGLAQRGVRFGAAFCQFALCSP